MEKRLTQPRLQRALTNQTIDTHFSSFSYSDRSYLEHIILVLNVLSLCVCVVTFFTLPFLRIHFRTYTYPEPEDLNSSVTYTTQILTWPSYTNDRGLSRIQPTLKRIFSYTRDAENHERLTMKELAAVRREWMNFQTCWVLDPLCSIATLVYEIAKRIRRRRRFTTDAAPMFAMVLMFFTLTMVRASTTFYYYNILVKASSVLDAVNVFMKEYVKKTDDVGVPYAIHVDLSRSYLMTSILSVFLAVVNITLIMDYLDPI
ncbi:unnamed protein product [Calicophoron daubneyi]|uniref:Uncharacterized protein n=1 Tax=Calicophoron daubneyi TaxID=300641 RepID=A0AAV2SVM1_CALDB